MEEDSINEDDAFENMSESEQLEIFRKLFDSVMVFNSHFAHYIRQNDAELFKRGVDYAKTFTEEDVPGIIMHYLEDDIEDGEQGTGT